MLDPVWCKIACYDTNHCRKNEPHGRCVKVDGNKYAPERREAHLPQRWMTKSFGLNFWCGNGTKNRTRQRQPHNAFQRESVGKAAKQNKNNSKCR